MLVTAHALGGTIGLLVKLIIANYVFNDFDRFVIVFLLVSTGAMVARRRSLQSLICQIQIVR